MAHYDYRCNLCQAVFEVNLPIAERNCPCEGSCPVCNEGTGTSIERLQAAPGVNYTIGGLKKQTPDSFKDVLRNIKSAHYGSTIDV